MALNIQGKKCPICNSYLFPEDDIVFCPVCGAPHHRDCYNAIGHCAFEDKHGTAEQYGLNSEEALSEPTPEATQSQKNDEDFQKRENICPNCKNKLDESMQVCPYCGRPRNARIITFDLLGGVKSEKDLGSGVTAGEACKLVQINTMRYIPKFASLKKRKASWNWAAFLFPEGWFLSRKMYKTGALFTSLLLAAQICLLPLSNIANTAILGSYGEYVTYICENLTSFGTMPLILGLVGILLTLALRIVSGVFGDYIYRKHTISTVLELRNDDDTEEKTRKKGGINIFGFLLGYVIVTYLPNIINMFI